MKLSTRCVGARSKPHTVTLTPRQTMNYAAGLADHNSRYFDDTAPAGIVAPPMLAVALTWPLSADFATYWGDTDFPVELQRQQVHYNESIVWHRTLRPDESLTIQGRIIALLPHRAGTRIGIRYTATGGEGDTVFTEFITGLLRGVTLDGEATSLENLPEPDVSAALSTGLWERSIPVDPVAAHLYDACTNIEFPIHTSAAFARAVGLPGTIYHGTATLGLAVRDILNREAGGDPDALAEVHAGFRGMVFPGSTIVLRVLGTLLENKVKTVYFEVETPEGAKAVRNGRLVLRAIEEAKLDGK